nr:hypothetical protein [Pantoea sp. 201603H]
MKYWLPGVAMLLMAFTTHAENYRVVYSPNLSLEVFIDNVESNALQDWCQKSLHLRIVSGARNESQILDNFLPRVGKLLTSQCSKLTNLSWQMTNRQGTALASGTADNTNDWKPVVTADATATANAFNAAPLDLSRPANSASLPQFELPGGCRFRTWWDENSQSIFIPDDRALTCSSEGWLEGSSQITRAHGDKTTTTVVDFYQGYPLVNIHAAKNSMNVVTVNNQRMVVAAQDAPDSWLVLPFNPALHAWSFGGTLLVKMDKSQADDVARVKAHVDALKKTWTPLVASEVKMTVLLVDDLHADLADPAIGAYRTVN